MVPDNKSVLMVSNRNLITDAVGAHLRGMGLNVLVASTGEEGIARLSASITAVIVDSQTPGLQGFLDLIKQDRTDVRAVLVSDGPVAPEMIGPNILPIRPTQGLSHLLALLSLRPQTQTQKLSNVIIVAGNSQEMASLRAAMEAEGMVVVPAANTEEVKQALSRGRVRVIVVDIALPGDGGLGTLRMVKESSPQTEVIVVGPMDREIARHATTDLGAFDYIHKIGDSTRLQTAVRTASSHGLFREEFSSWHSLWPFRSRHVSKNEHEHPESAELIAKRRQLVRKLIEVGSALTEKDPQLAGAIDACVGRAAGGDFHCPVGQLFLMDYLKVGHLSIPVKAGGASHSEPDGRVEIEDPSGVLESIFSQFESIAALEHDEEFQAALQQCRQNRESYGSCPLHSFLFQDSNKEPLPHS